MFGTTYDAQKKIWSGPKVFPTYNPEQTLGKLLLSCLEYRSSNIAQICADTGIALTGKQFRERAIVMAQYLQKMGLTMDDYVGFVTWNTENLMPTVFGCYVMGYPICPLSPIMTPNDLVNVYEIVKPKVIFCDKRNLKIVQDAVNMMKNKAAILTIMEKVDGYECATEIMRNANYSNIDQFRAPKFSSDHTLCLVCSSGSAESPKRIIKTHREMIVKYGDGWKLKHLKPAITMSYSPLFWISAINVTISAPLNHAAFVITTEISHPIEELIDIIRRFKVTHFNTIPFLVKAMLDTKNLKPFEHVECMMVSGFATTKTLCQQFAAYLPNGSIWVTYGLTETGVVSCNTTDDYDTIGHLGQNVEVKLIDSDGNSVGPNQHGELLVKDDPKFPGYHLDPKKTAETVKDGWFHTGDIAYFDDKNLLHYVGRNVEILNYEGYYIIPSEMEAMINEIEGVKKSAIVGLLEKDTMNYIIHAFVVPDESKNVTEQKILDCYNSKVIDQRKIRGGVHFINSLPLETTGKADLIQLREMAQKMSPFIQN